MSISSEREDRMRVAKTILEQLGGNKFHIVSVHRIQRDFQIV